MPRRNISDAACFLKSETMDKILGFFGTLLNVFYGSMQSLTLGCIMICLIIKLLFATTTKNYYNVPVVYNTLKPDIDEIDRKFRHNKEKRTKAVGEFLIARQYPVFSFIVYYVFMVLIGVLLSFAAHSPEKFIAAYEPGVGTSFLFIPDVTEFTFLAIKGSFPTPRAALYIVFPLLACVLQYLHDGYMSKYYFIDKTWFDYLSLALTVAACALLPAVFSVYWCVYQIANFIHNAVYFRKKTDPTEIKYINKDKDTNEKKRK